MLLKFHVAVVESLIVTTDPCVTRVAWGAKPTTRTKTTGAGWDGEGYHHRPHPMGGRGRRIPWGGGGVVAALHHSFIYIYIYMNPLSIVPRALRPETVSTSLLSGKGKTYSICMCH